jgi:hypothetical protein
LQFAYFNLPRNILAILFPSCGILTLATDFSFAGLQGSFELFVVFDRI